MNKILISDKLDEEAISIFVAKNFEVNYLPELGKDSRRLLELIDEFDGIAIRSETKIDKNVLDKARRLKVIGRAGIGIDNIDLREATSKGIVVMNTPDGNSITTAEHTIAMIFSVMRRIPSADHSTQLGKWEKSNFLGEEISGKILGIIG